jgi:hypothetical protein
MLFRLSPQESKTNNKEETMRAKIYIILLATVLMVGITNFPAAAAPAINLCRQTSLDALKACKSGARNNYWLATGKCNNLPTHSERKACRQQALQDKISGFEDCRAQFAARQEVCKTLGRDPYNPIINPADFVTVIDNPYFPLTPGSIYVYDGITEKGNEHVEVTVTDETKVILGVTCVAVRDTVTVDGLLEEDTIDWYAQDVSGNVWYFGENSLSYEGGLVVSLEGSWTAGVDGAKPGIIMKANPQVGDLYRQEFALGTAEDMAQVIGLNQPTTTPIPNPPGPFNNCLETKEFSPLEPDVTEHKFYAPGVGHVQTVDPTTGNHLDLTSFTPGL